MKPRFLLLAAGLLHVMAIQSQTFPGDFLDINDQKQFFSIYGSAGFDGNTTLHRVPKDSASSTIFASTLWVGAKNNAGGTFTATERFRVDTDWWPGPIMSGITDYNAEAAKYDRVWKINASDISYHLSHYSDAGYTPVEVIENWPGNGDVSKGQAAQLAPYFDQDSDGIYEPLEGDYPLIKGDQAVYMIINDHRTDNTGNTPKTSPQPMKIEVHAMAYAFDCPSDPVVNQAYFIDYTIYNRSGEDYHSVYAAQWTDFDLGNPQDDYVATDVGRSTYYGYNGDNFDEDNQGASGYREKLPVQAVTFLRGLPLDNDGKDNPAGIGSMQSINGSGFGDGVVDNERWGLQFSLYHHNAHGVMGDPEFSSEYYNYMTGRWKDGSQMIFGGQGYDVGFFNPIPARFMFPGTSDPLYYGTAGTDPDSLWTETTAGNLPADRRILGSTGPAVLPAGESLSMTLAFSFYQELMIGDSAQLLMQQGVDHLHDIYNAGSFECGSFVLGTADLQVPTQSPLLYPNPANDKVFAGEKFNLITVYNIAGEVVMKVEGPSASIDVSELPNGLYIFSADKGKTRTVQRIVVQR